MMINLLAIAILCCFVVNSGAIDSLKCALWRWLRRDRPYKEFSLKPLDCELCLTWWCGLSYIIFSGGFSLLSVLCVALVAWSTPIIVELMNLFVDLSRWGIERLRDKLNV